MYLSYEEYAERGGILDESSFLQYLKKATYKLDYYTQDRLKGMIDIPECVKDVLFEFIENLPSINTSTVNLSSYNNGVESFGFRENYDPYENLYRLAVEYLPVELISAAVD